MPIELKICGINSKSIIETIVRNGGCQYLGFIFYPPSPRHLSIQQSKELTSIVPYYIKKVAVLVKPNNQILEKIKNLPFDYYQLYNVTPKRTKIIKKKYKVKIITAITVENINDVNNYKNYENISEIILFDGKGYEKSIGFNHNLLINTPKNLTKMVAGNIRYNDKLDNLNKIADIVDISGGLETYGKKDASKINIFLENIRKLNDKNKKKNSSN